MHVRRKLVAGNWKMNGTVALLKEVSAIARVARKAGGVDVCICPPFTLIAPALTRSGGLWIGAQDCHAKESGAHTGSVSAVMAKEAGARLVIVGHSERRAECNESDADVRAKAEAALRHNLVAIVCVGESELDRGAGKHWPVVDSQLAGSLPDAWEEGELVVAYEPVWAIGTGRNATPEQAGEAHAHIRSRIRSWFGGPAGDHCHVIYGGSVKPDNIHSLIVHEDVDGALVGGASLDVQGFRDIVVRSRQ
jgi:triosephosphate isomerase (TIM)